MIVVGIDPGPTKSAYAIVQFKGNTLDVLSSGFFSELSETIADAIYDGFFALETVEGYAWMPERSSALIQTSFVAGVIDGTLSTIGHRVVRLSARQWRKVICNDPAASDKIIKRILQARIPTLPRTNAHVRDAIGVALAAIELERRAAVLNRAKLVP